jgi:hypothetical protein
MQANTIMPGPPSKLIYPEKAVGSRDQQIERLNERKLSGVAFGALKGSFVSGRGQGGAS